MIKGLVGVRIPNPKITNWKSQMKEYKQLKEWFKEIEVRFEKVKMKKELKRLETLKSMMEDDEVETWGDNNDASNPELL